MKQTLTRLWAICIIFIHSMGAPGSMARGGSLESSSIAVADDKILPKSRPTLGLSDLEFSLSSIDVLDRQNVWVLIREGGTDRVDRLRRSVVMRSLDGGRSWERQFKTEWDKEAASPSRYLNDVHFVTPRLGWVAGASGLILKTTDGGKSWIRQRTGTGASLDKIHFIDANTGWIMGHESSESAFVLYTKDAGLNWRLTRIEVKGWLSSIWFADGTNGWIVGEKGEAYHSSDSGAHWRSRAHELTSQVEDWSQTDVDFGSVKFIDGKLGFITAQIRQDLGVRFDPRGIVFKTRDGGRTWHPIVATSVLGLRSADFLNELEAWLVPRDLRNQLILHSKDGGKSWSSMPTPVAVLSVQFADSRTGWLVTNASDYPNIDQVYTTNDGGSTWIESKLPLE